MGARLCHRGKDRQRYRCPPVQWGRQINSSLHQSSAPVTTSNHQRQGLFLHSGLGQRFPRHIRTFFTSLTLRTITSPLPSASSVSSHPYLTITTAGFVATVNDLIRSTTQREIFIWRNLKQFPTTQYSFAIELGTQSSFICD